MLRTEGPPGEWKGTLRPEDYGFGAIPEGHLTQWVVDERVADLYQRALERTGVHIPILDPVLERVARRRQVVAELNPAPVRALLEKHDVQYPYTCTFGDAQLTVDKGVFCPAFSSVSPLLLSAIDYRPGERVLDAFAGSGPFGVNAALHGAAKVVSVDISERAVNCINKNAAANGVKIEARLGSVKDKVSKDETFDLIIAYPPWLPGEPADGLTTAAYDKGFQATVDFIKQLRHNLNPEGRCYLVTSDIIERCGLGAPEICRKVGLRTSVVRSANFGYETYSVHKIEHKSPLA